jgi:MoxR-like ATPase
VDLADYVLALLQATRQESSFLTGLSPRAGLALLSAARAWAMLEGRDHVLPEDVKAIFRQDTHRLGLAGDATASLTALLDHVAIP